MSYKGTGWIEGDEAIVDRMIERDNIEWAVRQERATIVAWLRSQGGHHDDIYAEAADDIESGAHHGKATT